MALFLFTLCNYVAIPENQESPLDHLQYTWQTGCTAMKLLRENQCVDCQLRDDSK